MMSYYSEKFLLKLNDCRQNIDSSHNDLRYNPDLSDITLVCEEDQQVEAHTLIFSAISPFFRNVLKRYRHSHPMIYIRGPYIMSQCGVHLPWRSKSPHIGPRRIHCSDGRYLTKCAGRVRDAPKQNFNLDIFQNRSDPPFCSFPSKKRVHIELGNQWRKLNTMIHCKKKTAT